MGMTRWKSKGLRTLMVLAALGLFVGLSACKKGQTKEDEQPTADKTQEKESADEQKKQEKSVVLYKYRFNPNSLTVTKGTTVKFMNKDPEKHNVKIAALDVDKSIESGGTFKHTFETTGEFAVENRLSEKPMKMTIVVKE